MLVTMNNFSKIIVAAALVLASCKTEVSTLQQVDGQRIAVDNTIPEDAEISNFIEVYKVHLNETLDAPLSYNPGFLSKSDGDLNTALGNLMADALMEQVDPVFKKNTGNHIDMVLLNHGGIRAEIPVGHVTTRTAYNIMPFENEVVIAELKGSKIMEMLEYLSKAKKAHPVSGIQIIADGSYMIKNATIKQKEISLDSTYFVATSDYLLTGGDNMQFFADPESVYESKYKIRNVMIDFFSKTDTIKSVIDNRYIRQ